MPESLTNSISKPAVKPITLNMIISLRKPNKQASQRSTRNQVKLLTSFQAKVHKIQSLCKSFIWWLKLTLKKVALWQALTTHKDAKEKEPLQTSPYLWLLPRSSQKEGTPKMLSGDVNKQASSHRNAVQGPDSWGWAANEHFELGQEQKWNPCSSFIC